MATKSRHYSRQCPLQKMQRRLSHVREKTIDGFVWRCPARHISIRRHSFFSQSHLHIPDIINFVITYAEGQSLWKCAQSAGVGYGRTAVYWYSFCLDLFIDHYLQNIRNERLKGWSGGRWILVWSLDKISLQGSKGDENMDFWSRWKKY